MPEKSTLLNVVEQHTIRYTFHSIKYLKVEFIMKYRRPTLLLALFVSFLSLPTVAEESIWNTVKKDYSEFYSSDRYIRMGIVFAGGAAIAHSNIDQDFQNNNKGNIFSFNDSYNFKQLGEGKYLISLSLISAGISSYLSDGRELNGVGKWGERAARAYFVGGPMVLATQWLTGASRPSEAPYKSDWKPFNDSNGVSGHAFIGSVPFLTIAYMNQDNPVIKYSAYLASTLAGLSRINDDAHYLSQVILGWYLGWESVDTVFSVDAKKNALRIQPLVRKDT